MCLYKVTTLHIYEAIKSNKFYDLEDKREKDLKRLPGHSYRPTNSSDVLVIKFLLHLGM